MSWWRRKPEPKPPPRFRSDCPACGFQAYSTFVPTSEYRGWRMKWIPEEQAVKVTCPRCEFSWKRVAEDERAALNLPCRFEEKA